MHHSRVMAGAMTLLLLSAPASWGAAPQKAKAVPTAEPFEGVVIAEGLAAPWDMVWGPDNHIWVSEREGSRITSVDPKTGEKKLVGSIPDVKVGPQHEGVLGIALDPDLGKNGSKNNVYVAHTYMDGGREHARIVRFHYDPQTRKIADPKVILSNMPAGDDHNGGRLRFQTDHVLAEMVRGLGCVVAETEAPFQPESGAYGASGGHHHHGDESPDLHDPGHGPHRSVPRIHQFKPR